MMFMEIKFVAENISFDKKGKSSRYAEFVSTWKGIQEYKKNGFSVPDKKTYELYQALKLNDDFTTEVERFRKKHSIPDNVNYNEFLKIINPKNRKRTNAMAKGLSNIEHKYSMHRLVQMNLDCLFIGGFVLVNQIPNISIRVFRKKDETYEPFWWNRLQDRSINIQIASSTVNENQIIEFLKENKKELKKQIIKIEKIEFPNINARDLSFIKEKKRKTYYNMANDNKVLDESGIRMAYLRAKRKINNLFKKNNL